MTLEFFALLLRRASIIFTIFLFLGDYIYSQTFNENWESGHFKSQWAQEGYSNQVSNDQSLSGTYSFKSELPARVHSNPRSELRFEGDRNTPKFQDQFTSWRISFSVYFPGNFKPDPIKESILQLKDIMDACDKAGGNPPFKIGLEGNEINASVRWTDQKCAKSLGLKYFGGLMKVKPGKWHYFTLEVGWDHRKNGKGYINLYASHDHPPSNRDRVLRYSGPTGYHDDLGHYLKLGIYKWLWKKRGNVKKSTKAGVRSRVLYYDDIRIERIDGDAPKANTAPVADAGADQTINLPKSSLTLSGKAIDAENNVSSYRWVQITGPSTATLKNEKSAKVEVSNLKAGVYLMRFMVRDSEGASDTDDVLITVNTATNQLPVADAGRTKEVTLPRNHITIHGEASDPDGKITKRQWKQRSGPSTASLSGETTNSLTASNLQAGTYVFEFTVTDDKDASITDALQVVVNPASNSDAADSDADSDNETADSETTDNDSSDEDSSDSDNTNSNASGTDASDSRIEVASKPINLTANINAANCSASNGSVNLNVSGGVGPYAYAWSNGAKSRNLNAIQAGTYKVTVTDSHGNKASRSFSVERTNAEIKVKAEIVNATCSDNNGSITIKVSGGTGPYTYQWSTNEKSALVKNLSPGNYKLKVTDKHGCFSNASYSINQNPGPGKPAILQAGDSLYIVQEAVNYQWFENGEAIIGANRKALKITEAGTYSVEISDNNACTVSSDYFVSREPVFPVNQGGTLQQVDFYPIPANREINVRLQVHQPAQASVTIYDFTGQVLLHQELGMVQSQLTKTLPVDQFPTGTYLIRARANDEVVTRRFIKY